MEHDPIISAILELPLQILSYIGGNPMEAMSAALGIFGSLLLAMKSRFAGWAFVAYLASNAGWIAFAISHGYHALIAQHATFSVIALIGIWTWLIKPKMDAGTAGASLSIGSDEHADVHRAET